jgi:hypothetical protein
VLQNKIIGGRVSGKSDLKRGCGGRRHRCVPADVASCALVLHLIEEVRFAFDSPLEERGFEPSVPQERLRSSTFLSGAKPRADRSQAKPCCQGHRECAKIVANRHIFCSVSGSGRTERCRRAAAAIIRSLAASW